MRNLLLLLFLASCAASPHEYRQGAPVAPRPPAFNPVTDSPITTGQPGYVRPEERPRGTDKRVLPPTLEPGIWASDKPKRVLDHDPPTLFAVPLPYTPLDEDPLGAFFARRCADDYIDVAWNLDLFARAVYVEEKTRTCMVAKLFEHCLDRIQRATKAAREAGEAFDAALEKALARERKLAEAHRKNVCKNESRWPPDVSEIYDGLRLGLQQQRGL